MEIPAIMDENWKSESFERPLNLLSSEQLNWRNMSKKTYCNVLNTIFIWRVKYPNFSLGCDIRSPSFSVDYYSNTMFYVNIFSVKESELYNYISVYLAKHETYCGPNSITFRIKLFLADEDEEEYFVEETIRFSNQQMILLETAVPVKRRMKCCFHGFFRVRLEIEPSNEAPCEDLFGCNQKELEMLSSDLSRALKSKRFCDLIFSSIEGKWSVSLHKCILATRYMNLAAYLEIDEKAIDKCNLRVNQDAIDVLTQYLYSGSIDTKSVPFGLHEMLKRAPLDHLDHVLYPTPRVIHASTTVGSKYGSFVWNVPKFSRLKEDNVLVNTLCIDPKLQWTKIKIFLYKRVNDQRNLCLAFKIVRTEQKDKMYMLCTISLVDDEDGKYSRTFEHVFRSERHWNITSFIEVDAIKNNIFLSGDNLKLRLEFIISDLIETLQYECIRCLENKRGQIPVVSMNLWALQRDLKSLYLDNSYTDCSLLVGEEMIPAHKVILSARSPVFSGIINDNSSENETSRIVLDDCDPLVIKSLLCYMYCGELPKESQRHITDLYRAAHKYQIKQLPDKCSRILGSLLAVHRVPDVLKIADENNDEYLKECVRSFVHFHADKVFTSVEWDTLKRERIDLSASLMNDVLELSD